MTKEKVASVVEVRREKVKHGMLRGNSYRKMAKELKCSHNTIMRDADAIRQEVIDEVKKKPFEKVLGEFVLKYDELFYDVFEFYRTTDDMRVKSRLARTLATMMIEKIKVMQSLGIVHEAPISLKQEFVVKWIKRVEESKEQTINYQSST